MKLGHRHQCDECGKIAPWDENWRRYSSILHDETCPDLMPDLCSAACQQAFMGKLETGGVAVPKLCNHRYYATVTEPGKGYGAFGRGTAAGEPSQPAEAAPGEATAQSEEES